MINIVSITKKKKIYKNFLDNNHFIGQKKKKKTTLCEV